MTENTNLEFKGNENSLTMTTRDIMNCLLDINPTVQEAYEMYAEANQYQIEADFTRFFGLGTIIFAMMFWLIPGAVLIGINRYRKENQQCLYRRANFLREQANSIINSISSPIPYKYRFPAAIEYAYELCQTGRVNSLPELFDRLDEQIHRWNLENQNQELIRNQQETNNRLSRVESASESAATNSFISAAASIASAASRM